MIDPRGIVQPQVILQGDHAEIRNRRVGGLHEFIDDFIRVIRTHVHVIPDLLQFLRQDAGDPAAHRLIIMGSRVHDTVIPVAERKIFRSTGRIPGIKSKFQHFHIREAGIPDQSPHGIRHIAQIFGYDRRIAVHCAYRIEQGNPRSLLPVSVLRRVLIGRNGKEFVKPPEMIDPDHVIEFTAFPDALQPPLEAVRRMPFPVIKRVAPHLAVGRKPVRRHPRDQAYPSPFIQHEQIPVRPEIRAVVGNIDRYIAYDADALLRRISPQSFPFPQEFILEIHVEADFIRQLFPPAQPCLRHIIAYVLLPGLQVRSSVSVLDRHEQGIIFKPESIFFTEAVEFLRILMTGSAVCLTQQRKASVIQLAVIDLSVIIAEISFPAFLFSEQSVPDQRLQADEVRITGISGKGLVWGITISGGPKGQYLPVRLFCIRQKIHKAVRLFRKASDSVLPRQTEYRQQNSARAHVVPPPKAKIW